MEMANVESAEYGKKDISACFGFITNFATMKSLSAVLCWFIQLTQQNILM